LISYPKTDWKLVDLRLALFSGSSIGDTARTVVGTMTETHKADERHRRVDDEEIDDLAPDDAGSPDEDMPDAPPTKKRRRGAKANSEKKFECKHEGCGKSYSRAEHLYRHQLNRQ
jgi:hypothetical protein